MQNFDSEVENSELKFVKFSQTKYYLHYLFIYYFNWNKCNYVHLSYPYFEFHRGYSHWSGDIKLVFILLLGLWKRFSPYIEVENHVRDIEDQTHNNWHRLPQKYPGPLQTKGTTDLFWWSIYQISIQQCSPLVIHTTHSM